MNRELLANYAVRARRYSEAVAKLGSHDRVNPEFVRLMRETVRLQALCFSASNDLQSYVEQVLSTLPQQRSKRSVKNDEGLSLIAKAASGKQV